MTSSTSTKNTGQKAKTASKNHDQGDHRLRRRRRGRYVYVLGNDRGRCVYVLVNDRGRCEYVLVNVLVNEMC